MMRITTIFYFAIGLICISCNTDLPDIYFIESGQSETDFATGKFVESLKNKGYKITDTDAGARYNVLISVNNGQAGSYELSFAGDTLKISGGDRAGVLYGVQEVSEQLSRGIGIENISYRSVSPHLPFRAIKFNLPWDSYRRSDALQLHMETCQDTVFWEKFLDMMAENRFNVLTLWNLHPFDWMIRLEKYPEASSLTDEEYNTWRQFWTTLFRMAKERGIETYIVNWNIFVSDSFAKAHGVAEYSMGDTFIGVSDTSELVKDYNRECIREVINQYPDLTGVGFSLGEAMDGMTPRQREEWCLDVIVKGMQQADRKARLIHRVPFSANLESGGSTDITVEKMTRNALESIEVPSPVWVEIKFNWSHAHSTPKLIKVHGGEISDTYWNPVPDNYRIAWMMRNEDFFALRWGQTDFIRKHLEMNVHPYVGGYFVGSECYIPAKDYFTKVENRDWDYAFERQWMFYKTWGRLLFDPSTPDNVFVDELESRYGNGEILYQAYNAAGTVPLMIASFWDLAWDFTLYTEGLFAFDGEEGKAEFITIERLMEHPTLDTMIISVDEYTGYLVRDIEISRDKKTPLEFAEELENTSIEAFNLVEGLKASGISYQYELADIRIWSYLGRYFSEKVRAAVSLSLFKKTGEIEYKNRAIEQLENGLVYWDEIIGITTPLYKEMPVVHLNQREDKYFHWAKLKSEAEMEIEEAREY